MMLARVAVRSRTRLSPSFVRLVLGGPELAGFGVAGPVLDQRIKLILPGPAGLPQLRPECWWADFQALPEHGRGAVRTYTLRAITAADELVVDVVVHPGAHGPGSAWAGGAAPGDEVLVLVPAQGAPASGIEWAPGEAGRLLIVADETGVPAACSILESLPAGANGAAFLEVPLAEDVQDVTAPPGVDVRWLPRSGRPVGELATTAVVEHLGGGAVPEIDEEEADLLWETPTYSSSGEAITDRPAAGAYAWIAGEARMVTGLRRHLVGEIGMPRQQVAFMGYWREGVAMRG